MEFHIADLQEIYKCLATVLPRSENLRVFARPAADKITA